VCRVGTGCTLPDAEILRFPGGYGCTVKPAARCKTVRYPLLTVLFKRPVVP
jgi:hypothetical protein